VKKFYEGAIDQRVRINSAQSQLREACSRFSVARPEVGRGHQRLPAISSDLRVVTRTFNRVRAIGPLHPIYAAVSLHWQSDRASVSRPHHPKLVDRLVVMDNVPTRIVARLMNAQIAREYWFFKDTETRNIRLDKNVPLVLADRRASP
jgi:hypothetical protein